MREDVRVLYTPGGETVHIGDPEGGQERSTQVGEAEGGGEEGREAARGEGARQVDNDICQSEEIKEELSENIYDDMDH